MPQFTRLTHCVSLAALILSAAVPAARATEKKGDEDKEPIPIAQPAERPFWPAALTSGLGVPASETFHLGERPSGEFTVSAYNRGSVAVRILATRGKRREVVGEVRPGETVVRKFKSNDGVLVQNLSDQSGARLKVEVWGAKDLAMYYVPNDKEPGASE